MTDDVISREVVANTYLSGTEIEVGALHNPLRVPDGEHLEMIGDATQDFVIANHFIENVSRLMEMDYSHSLPCLYAGYDSGILLKGKRCFAFSV